VRDEAIQRVSAIEDEPRASILAAEGPVLKTVTDIPIVSTGTYHLAGNSMPGGSTTFTQEDLADACAAYENDSAVKSPKIKLTMMGGQSHAKASLEPAFGRFTNLRMGDNGQTLYADAEGVPAWLADIWPVAFPNRSIEADFGVTTATDNEWRMVIHNVALLGVTLPGVSTLEDLPLLYGEEMPEGTEIEAANSHAVAEIGEDPMGVFKRGAKVLGEMSIDDVRRAFYDDLSGDQAWWWIRDIRVDPEKFIVDDDDGGLYSVTWVVDGDDVEFGDPEEVEVKYVAAQGAIKAQVAEGKSLMAFASRAESRPETDKQEEPMDKLREKFGLPADATEDDVLEAMEKEAEKAGGDPEPETEPDSSGGDPAATGDPAEPEPEPAPEPAGATASIDKDALKELKADAAAGREARAEQLRIERDTFIETEGIQAGRFPPASRDHYTKRFDQDPEGAKAEILSLEKNVVPVGKREEGSSTDGEDNGVSASAYDEGFLSPQERRRIKAAKEGEGPPQVTSDENRVVVNG
jgi:hypothetical protein